MLTGFRAVPRLADRYLLDMILIGQFLAVRTEKTAITTEVIWRLAILLVMHSQYVRKHPAVTGIATKGFVLGYEASFTGRH